MEGTNQDGMTVYLGYSICRTASGRPALASSAGRRQVDWRKDGERLRPRLYRGRIALRH